jgi:site-specific recombinase XerD
VIPIGEQLREILAPHCKGLGDDDLISTNSVGKSWGDVGLSTAYSRVAQRHGVKVARYHALRACFATQLFIKAGADAVTVQHLLGHSNLSVTQRYAQHSHKRAVEAIAAL